MEECVRMMQQSLSSAPTMKKRAKSVYAQRNLGTIKERKKEKRQEKEITSEETIMRILRMRYDPTHLDQRPALTIASSPLDRELRSSSHSNYKSSLPCKLNRNNAPKILNSGDWRDHQTDRRARYHQCPLRPTPESFPPQFNSDDTLNLLYTHFHPATFFLTLQTVGHGTLYICESFPRWHL